jgi:hypothetical protein
VALFARRVEVELAAIERNADPILTVYSLELAQSATSVASCVIS